MRIVAISDIHGCLDTFKGLLKQLQFSKKDHLFLIGDFIDRGENSKGVIDHIWHLQKEGYTISCLRGNHEQMLLDSRMDTENAVHWKYHGGSTTLESFKTNQIKNIPTKYFSWMEALPLFVEHEDYIFVHAGLNFDVPNPLTAFDSMLWIRYWYKNINYDWLGKRIIVHGHTPTNNAAIELLFNNLDYEQVLNIDAGCVFEYKNLGYLCGVDLSNRQLYFQKRI